MSKLHTFISGSAEWTFYFVVSGNQRPSISKTEPILLAASCLSKYSIHVFISFTIFRSKVNLDSFLPPLNIKRVIPFYGGEGNGTPLQYSCLENPMDGGAWKAAVHGVAKSRTRPRDFTFTFHFCTGEGNGNPLQCSCLENPRDGGAWWAAVYGVAQSRTRLKRLSSSSSTEPALSLPLRSVCVPPVTALIQAPMTLINNLDLLHRMKSRTLLKSLLWWCTPHLAHLPSVISHCLRVKIIFFSVTFKAQIF